MQYTFNSSRIISQYIVTASTASRNIFSQTINCVWQHTIKCWLISVTWQKGAHWLSSHTQRSTLSLTHEYFLWPDYCSGSDLFCSQLVAPLCRRQKKEQPLEWDVTHHSSLKQREMIMSYVTQRQSFLQTLVLRSFLKLKQHWCVTAQKVNTWSCRSYSLLHSGRKTPQQYYKCYWTDFQQL